MQWCVLWFAWLGHGFFFHKLRMIPVVFTGIRFELGVIYFSLMDVKIHAYHVYQGKWSHTDFREVLKEGKMSNKWDEIVLHWYVILGDLNVQNIFLFHRKYINIYPVSALNQGRTTTKKTHKKPRHCWSAWHAGHLRILKRSWHVFFFLIIFTNINNQIGYM